MCDVVPTPNFRFLIALDACGIFARMGAMHGQVTQDQLLIGKNNMPRTRAHSASNPDLSRSVVS